MASVTVKSLGRLSHSVTAGDREIIVDERPDKGGDGAGMDPFELLLASLGAWTAITLRLYAERKGWDLGEVTIDLSHEKSVPAEGGSGPPLDRIRLHIKSTGKLDQEQAERLRAIAGRCPVHRTLMASPEIIEEFEVVAG